MEEARTRGFPSPSFSGFGFAVICCASFILRVARNFPIVNLFFYIPHNSLCPLWVISGRSRLYHPNVRFRVYSGRSIAPDQLTAPSLCCVFSICAEYAYRDDRLSSALAFDPAVKPRFEGLSDGQFPRLRDSNLVLQLPDPACLVFPQR